MAESKELIDSGLKEVRTISHLLHPPMLDEVGLLPAIRWYATGFAQRSGIDVEAGIASHFSPPSSRDGDRHLSGRPGKP